MHAGAPAGRPRDRRTPPAHPQPPAFSRRRPSRPGATAAEASTIYYWWREAPPRLGGQRPLADHAREPDAVGVRDVHEPEGDVRGGLADDRRVAADRTRVVLQDELE